MKRSEKEAKEKLKAHGKIVTKQGITEGGGHHQEDSPTTTLKHGPFSRLLGKPPKEVK